ncbi:hypothetical protein T05_5021 [Trichinella murrelli]|uniref:Uncharacterized protein n=1 Tax=Trichinella murrelli TaxID=144512 RepID=A0A0V0U983_9BILA|nr:hypothetical protein T05_5021 [Trichinella murrelli]
MKNQQKVSTVRSEPLELNLAEVVQGYGEIENCLPMRGYICRCRIVQRSAIERGADQAARQADQLDLVDSNGRVVALVQADEVHGKYRVVLSDFGRHQHAHVQKRALFRWR